MREPRHEVQAGFEASRRRRLVRRSMLALAVPLLVATAAGNSLAQSSASFPDRPIRLLVGYPPGGGADTLGRLIAKQMSSALEQPVVVENRPGAGQNIATATVANAPADGYTLLLSSSALGVNLHIYSKIYYDPIGDFAPVAVFGKSPNLLVVRSNLEASSVAELIAYARQNPGKMNFSTSGSGSTQHLAGELLNHVAGIKVTHIPYRGTGPSLTAILAGEVDFTFTNLPSAKPLLAEGRARALAITSDKRSRLFPEVPTMAEAGVKDFSVSAWYGVLAPAGTPPEIVKKLNAVINQAIRQEAFSAQLEELGVDPVAETPVEFSRFLKAEIEQWGRVVAATGIKIE